MNPGETRSIHDAKSGRSWTLTRTARPYAYDLADAYNAERPPSDHGWFVDGIGGLRFGLMPHAERRLRNEAALRNSHIASGLQE